MTRQTERQPGSDPQASAICSTCGGRGALRQGDDSYRTCLECLGQGRLPGLEAATTTAAVLNKGAALLQGAAVQPAQPAAITNAETSVSR